MAKHKKRGRPPSGEFPGKTATFTTRIQPSTRRALEAAAKKRPDKSISAAAERILKAVLLSQTGEPRNKALAAALVLLAENIERDTKKSWLDDPWAGFALANGVEHLVRYFAPAPTAEGTPPTPKAVEELAEKMGELREQFRKPHGFGRLQAQFLIREIEQAASSGPINEWTMPIFFSERSEKLALIGSELADSRKGKPK
jgi:hypothetical protein